MEKIPQKKKKGNIEEGATFEAEFPFFISPNNIIDIEGKLTTYEKLTYLILCRYGNLGRVAFPSYNTIARKGGFSKDTAIRAVKGLLEKGGITKKNTQAKSGGHTSNNYTVDYHFLDLVAHSDKGSSSQQQGGVADSNSINNDPMNKNEEAAAADFNTTKTDQVVSVYIDQLQQIGLVPVHNKQRLIKQYNDSPLAAIGVKQVIAKLKNWFKTADNYTVSQGYALGLFIKDYNSIEKPPRVDAGICPECNNRLYEDEEHTCKHIVFCQKCNTGIRYTGARLNDEEVLQAHVCNKEALENNQQGAAKG